MWDKLQIVTYVLMLSVALWAFAATYEPLRSQAFGRPVTGWVVIAIRMTATLAAAGCVVVLVWDICFR